jgi:hypothetical protein
LPGAPTKMAKRDPEQILTRALSLSREEIAYHFVGRTNRRIVQSLLNLLASEGAAKLAKRAMSARAYRPTRISEAYIWHMKGILFEIQMRDRQLELLQHLHDLNKGRPGTYALIRGAKARLYVGDLKDKVLGKAVDFSDGLIARLEGRRRASPVLTLEHIHEMKSGFSGDIHAVLQVEKWNDYLPRIGELVIPPTALVNRVRPAGIARPETFSDYLRTIGQKDHRQIKQGQIELQNGDPVRAHRFLMNPELAPDDLLKEVKGRAEIDTKAIKDPVFLANSRKRPPDIDDLLADDYRNHVVDPEIQPNLVAEELEWTAIRLLEVVAEDVFKGRIGATSQFFELTSQVLKAAP